MSCQLSVLSRFQDVTVVRRFLFPHLKDSSPKPAGEQSHADDAENWNDDWGWSIDENQSDGLTDTAQASLETVDDGTHKWLQNSIVSLSPNNDIIAIANEDRICVLKQKWDPQNKGEEIDTCLTSAWQNSIKQEEGELITDVICLPLASQKRSTQGAPDWTCVVAGFSSGYVRMYTETGVLLLSQLLHLEPVQKLKCRTYEPPRCFGAVEGHVLDSSPLFGGKARLILDEFSRTTSSEVIVTVLSVKGMTWSRSHTVHPVIFRDVHELMAIPTTASGAENYVQPPPLAYKKWALNEQEKISDLVSCGVSCPSAFDQLRNASMQGGFNANPRTNPPAASVYLTSGTGPYVGFYYAIEGSMQPILSDVAIAMANKLKSALISAASGWLGFGGKQKEDSKEKTPKIEPATPLPLRFGLPDKRRSADSIILSPCNNYIATTDSFGRVILVDVQRGIAVRMWKGYRDAQLGWVQIKEEDGNRPQSPGHSRVAQFLIIYAPRRGILEVWTAVHGPRVAAFNVSKHGILACPSYGLMGLNNVTCRSVKARAFQCALVDPEGFVKTLDIPFHLALSDKSSKRARDLHLLKKLKSVLKEASEETESLRSTVKEIFLDIRIASINHQALERILSTRYLSVSFMQDIVQACITQLSAKGEDNLDIDSKMLLRFANMEAGLLDTYYSIHKLSTQITETDPASQSSHVEILESSLGMKKEEAVHISELLEKYVSVVESGKSVKFSDSAKNLPLLAATSFLHCFSARSHASISEDSGSLGKGTGTIYVSKEVTEERRDALAHLLFHGCLTGACEAGDIGVILQKSNLAPQQLLKLLLRHCLSLDDLELRAIPSLKAIVRTITAMTDTSEVLVDHSSKSPWWQRVRDSCSQSEQNCAAYITALVCRRVATDFFASQTEAKDPDADTASDKEDDNNSEVLRRERKSLNSSSDLSSWVNVSMDMAEWELLIKQLEDCVALSTLLHINIPTREKEPDVLEGTKEPVRVSVSKLLDGGKGSISELVAHFVASQGLDTKSLYKLPPEGEGQDGATLPEKRETLKTSQSNLERLQRFYLQAYLEDLHRRFPHSLDNDVLISNCSWEYAVLWNKDPEEVQHLHLSLEYLMLVQNAVLRQGVSSMMWHMFVTKRMSATAQLMEKVGKAPKDRLCRKEVNMSDKSLTKFAGLVVELLKIIMEANCEANEVPVFNVEHNWQSVRGPASLGELAVDAKATNYGLVRLHWQLALFTHAVLVFNMKNVKVLSLFERKGKAAFFKDLHSHPLLPNKNVDDELSLERRMVLSRIVTEAVSTLGPPVHEAKVTKMGPNMPPLTFVKRPSMLNFYWPRTCMTLADELVADEEFIRMHFVIELYSFGHDDLARTVHGFVGDREKFGRQLLLVAGRRMAYRVIEEHPEKKPRLLGEMTTGLSYWLQSMDMSKLVYKLSPLSDNLRLLHEAAKRLPENSREHDIALELTEFTELLITLKISAEPEVVKQRAE